ncbi:hypothetical protein I79_001194 [Cricetulus griseus]|uniref:Secreted protein n=1 Tax=Cricetulus griseus TaxID=10029 RepID=G3GU45_CRIGR|nr:hypothetical protein I79_001194 [Cricetulus griseus]
MWAGRSQAFLCLLSVYLLGFLLRMLGYHACNHEEKKHNSEKFSDGEQEENVVSQQCHTTPQPRWKGRLLGSCRSRGGLLGQWWGSSYIPKADFMASFRVEWGTVARWDSGPSCSLFLTVRTGM